MKNTTHLLSQLHIKGILIAIVLMLYSNFSFSQVDLRTCGFHCTSNNYTLNDVFLSLTDVYGVPITNSTCTIGTVTPVYILMNYTSNASSSIYFTRLNSDLSINGVKTFINVLLGTVTPGAGQRKIFGPFNWTCGDELILSNSIVAWKTSNSNDPGANYTCSSYNAAQCDFSSSTIISKPLAVQFTYTACTVETINTVNFTSTTNRGTPPYNYAWTFSNEGTSNFPNPVNTFSTTTVN